MSEQFRIGQPILIMDRKDRTKFVVLREGASTNLRGDHLPHDELAQLHDGQRWVSARNREYRLLSATLKDHQLLMRRAAAIIYPKDVATVLMWGDIGPGMKVVEGGLGSGSMALALLRAIGAEGSLTTYELRQESVNRARKNTRAFLGETPNHHIKLQNIYDGIEETEVDRVVLDVPEPWNVVPTAADALCPGGVFTAYVPTAVQMQRCGLALERGSAFTRVEAMESILRPWYVTERSLRPEQQIIGHTGFLIFARRVQRRRVEEEEAPEAQAPETAT